MPVKVPPAVPPSVTSPVVKPTAIELNTTVKLIGLVPVGSAWPTAWSIVTVGGTTSHVTALSVNVDATLRLPTASMATPAGWSR